MFERKIKYEIEVDVDYLKENIIYGCVFIKVIDFVKCIYWFFIVFKLISLKLDDILELVKKMLFL